MSLPKVNVVIVGAGAGGGIVAKELAQAGLSVVLLERGGWPSFDNHNSTPTTLTSAPLTPAAHVIAQSQCRHRGCRSRGRDSGQGTRAGRLERGVARARWLAEFRQSQLHANNPHLRPTDPCRACHCPKSMSSSWVPEPGAG